MINWTRRRARMLLQYAWHEPITRRQAVVAAYEDWRWMQGK